MMSGEVKGLVNVAEEHECSTADESSASSGQYGAVQLQDSIVMAAVHSDSDTDNNDPNRRLVRRSSADNSIDLSIDDSAITRSTTSV